MSIKKIPEARFIENGNVDDKDINGINLVANKISKAEYREKYDGKVFCKEKGCTAKLHHVELNVTSRFFRTNRGANNKHKEKCPSEVAYDGTTTYTGKNGEDIEISDEHIVGTLERRKKSHKNNNVKETDVNNNKSITRNDNRKRNPPKPIEQGQRGIPSLNGSGKKADEDGSRTRIIGRGAGELKPSDYGKPRCVDGTIIKVDLYENYARIKFKEKNKLDTYIELGEAFKNNSSTAFRFLSSISKYVDYKVKLNEPVYCVCVGFVTEVNNKVLVQVYKEIELNIDDYTITQFILNNSTLLDNIKDI